MEISRLRYGLFSCVLLLHTQLDAADPGGGAAKADQAPFTSKTGAGSLETAAAAFRAMSEATAKGLHGPGGSFLSAEAQASYCSNELRKYSLLLESVRIQEVPEVPETENFRAPSPDSVLNRRYKSVLSLLNSGFGVPVQGTRESEEAGREKLYFLKPDELKGSQRAWIAFRDEHAKLFNALNPKVGESAWLDWLTSQRVFEMNAWMRFPASVESIGKSATESPEVAKAVQTLQSVMAFADTQRDLARRLDTRGGHSDYNEFLETEWPPLKALLIQQLSRRQQEEYQKAVEKGELVLKQKLVPIRKKTDKIMRDNEGGSLASLVANGVHIFSEHDRILRMKPFVKLMPALLQAELVSLFQVLEKHGV